MEAFHKLLRTEYLRAVSAVALVSFPLSEYEASALLYFIDQSARHSHQSHRMFSGATALHVAVAPFHQLIHHKEVSTTRYASFIALAAFLTFGLGTAVSFAGEPAPAEQKEKKGMSSSKADDVKKKDEKKDMGGK